MPRSSGAQPGWRLRPSEKNHLSSCARSTASHVSVNSLKHRSTYGRTASSGQCHVLMSQSRVSSNGLHVLRRSSGNRSSVIWPSSGLMRSRRP